MPSPHPIEVSGAPLICLWGMHPREDGEKRWCPEPQSGYRVRITPPYLSVKGRVRVSEDQSPNHGVMRDGAEIEQGLRLRFVKMKNVTWSEFSLADY